MISILMITINKFSKISLFYFKRMNTDVVSDDESDDFNDEEEEQRKEELPQQQQQQQQTTPAVSRRSSISDNHLYRSPGHDTNMGHSQWYIDLPKNAYLEALPSQSSIGESFIFD